MAGDLPDPGGRATGLLEGGPVVVAAVPAGRDSTCLLDIRGDAWPAAGRGPGAARRLRACAGAAPPTADPRATASRLCAGLGGRAAGPRRARSRPGRGARAPATTQGLGRVTCANALGRRAARSWRWAPAARLAAGHTLSDQVETIPLPARGLAPGGARRCWACRRARGRASCAPLLAAEINAPAETRRPLAWPAAWPGAEGRPPTLDRGLRGAAPAFREDLLPALRRGWDARRRGQRPGGTAAAAARGGPRCSTAGGRRRAGAAATTLPPRTSLAALGGPALGAPGAPASGPRTRRARLCAASGDAPGRRAWALGDGRAPWTSATGRARESFAGGRRPRGGATPAPPRPKR